MSKSRKQNALEQQVKALSGNIKTAEELEAELENQLVVGEKRARRPKQR